MAFRKRNVAIGPGRNDNSDRADLGEVAKQDGVRTSPSTAHAVISTGTPSLDELLGHSGLPLGTSLLIEEGGTTDFAGALLRFYAAEGICQGQTIDLVGVGEEWIRMLPGVADDKHRRSEQPSSDEERMRIAWRYEKLGQAGEKALPNRSLGRVTHPNDEQRTFCHTFDLTKRLDVPHDAKVNHICITSLERPFDSVLKGLSQSLQSSPPSVVHRLIIPTILSPALWPSPASRPDEVLRFLHALRSLLSQYAGRFTAMVTLPLELHPRRSALVRSAEILSDGVLELAPFPHLMNASNSLAESGGARGNDEQPQGMVKVHKLPIATERGEGGAGEGNNIGADLAFTVSRRKFVIKPFSLPPMEGDQDAQKEAGKLTGKDVEF